MKLSEIFSQLTSGELSQVAIGGAKNGGIAEADYHKVLNNVNLGLEDLHTRFTLRKGRLVLVPQAGKVSYKLDSVYAVTNQRSREAVRYILDTAEEPFKDDLIKVERVLTDAGYEIPLNLDKHPVSIATPTSTVLRLPKVLVPGNPMGDFEHLKTTQLEVFYRATHPMIIKPLGYFDPSRVEVELPRAYLQALLLFIASRVHAPIGLGQEHYNGSVYASKYEQECVRLASTNVEIDTAQVNTRAERNGWI